MRAMQLALLKHGFSPVVAMDIIPADGSIPIEKMGEQVRVAACELILATGVHRIDVVAYSMGALAARYFLQRLGGKEIIRRFISISGPHHGTITAWFRPQIACRQMRPGSDLLNDLNADPDPFHKVDVFSYYTPYDLMVFPSHSSIMEYAHNRAFHVLLHPLMITDKRVIEAVVQTLAASMDFLR